MKKLLAVGATVALAIPIVQSSPASAAKYCARPASGPSISYPDQRSVSGTFNWYCQGWAAVKANCYSRRYGTFVWRTDPTPVTGGGQVSVASCQVSVRDEIAVGSGYVTG